MNYSRICEYLARISKMPIREYSETMELMHVFGDFNTVPDPFQDDITGIHYYLNQTEGKVPIFYSSEHQGSMIIFFSEIQKSYFVLSHVHYLEDLKSNSLNFTIDLEALCESAGLLYEYLTGHKISTFDILHGAIDDDITQKEINKIHGITTFTYRENRQLHNPYEQELREQGSIREGNVEKLKKSFEEKYAGRLATLSKNKLRSIKNLGIVVLAISTRAAIEGGLHPEQAFLLSDTYILKVDEAQSQSEIYQIVRGAEVYFTQLVAEVKDKKSTNPIVYRTKNLILKHLHEKVVVEELAKELNKTPAYLSTIFKKDTGLTIHQYVMKEKLKVAENLLYYSDYSIEEISNYLAFSSQSHFGSVFKHQYGITPNKFRLKYGIEKG